MVRYSHSTCTHFHLWFLLCSWRTRLISRCWYFVTAGMISDPTESSILPWLSIILSYIFTGFWVLPIFWISKPINSIWFQVSMFMFTSSHSHVCHTLVMLARILHLWHLMRPKNNEKEVVAGTSVRWFETIIMSNLIYHRSPADTQPLSQLISRLIADFLFSIVLEILFLFQVGMTFVGVNQGTSSLHDDHFLMHLCRRYVLPSCHTS